MKPKSNSKVVHIDEPQDGSENISTGGNYLMMEEITSWFRAFLRPWNLIRTSFLLTYGNFFVARFYRLFRTEDLERAIVSYHDLLLLCPPGHPLRSKSLVNLSLAIQNRFQQTGRLEDLDDAVIYGSESLVLHPPGHRLRSISLIALAGSTRIRFEQTGRSEDLDDAIRYNRESLKLRPPGHRLRCESLISLSAAMFNRFEQAGRMEDLEDSITYSNESIRLCPLGHPNRSVSINNLAAAVWTRFSQKGSMEDLENAIKYSRESLLLRPPGHPDRASSIDNLAAATRARFQQTGKMEDLDDAIEYNRESLLLRPPGHPFRTTTIHNLAVSIRTRFEQKGGIEDIEEAITYSREFLVLCPLGHPMRSKSLTNLAAALRLRFEQMGRMEDLMEAITYNRESLMLCPLGHPDRCTSLLDLATAIKTRFKQTSRMEDLEDAIRFNREALMICSPEHPVRAAAISNLAAAIWTRFKRTSRMEDLEDTIRYNRESLELRPPGHSNRYISLISLAAATQIRFERVGRVGDLEEAVQHLSDAEAVLPADHPMHTLVRHQFACVYLLLVPKSLHLPIAFDLFEKAVKHSSGSVNSRFKAALEWISAARRHDHESIVTAYSISLMLLHRFLLITPNVESQQKFLASTVTIPKSLASDAASSAIEAGQLDIAVELLEYGRAIIWSNIRSYRHPIEALREVNRELADKFEALSGQLERHAISSESETIDSKVKSEQMLHRSQAAFEVIQQKYLVVSEEWNRVVDSIRQVEGFSDFLKTVPFSTLRKAAAEGPIIIVNISDYRSDAIIVGDVDPPVLVPLPKASPDDITFLSFQLVKSRASGDEAFSANMRSILRTLWDIIVCPVTDQLAALGVAERRRIWWCPTSDLCALPLHAAGPYLPNQKNLPDLYISSYTSTLSVLITARSDIVQRTSTPSLLVVGDIGRPGAYIPSVKEEVHRIQRLGDFVNVLVGEEANSEAVINGLREHSWVHFACHGHRNINPFHSSFQLHAGERLELVDLIKARLPNAEHVFISACHGAAADTQGTPDEVIHLAGALQFCGFRSAVGTLWAMADVDGPDVAEDFYRYILREPANVANFRDSAAALNSATREMRRRKVPLGHWVNFIHIGA